MEHVQPGPSALLTTYYRQRHEQKRGNRKKRSFPTFWSAVLLATMRALAESLALKSQMVDRPPSRHTQVPSWSFQLVSRTRAIAPG
jgi:hypothetical protein